MTLRSPSFEKRMRKLLREETRRNPELKKQRRAGSVSTQLPPWAVQSSVSLIFTVLLVSITAGTGLPELGYAALSFWATASALRKTRQLQQVLYGSEGLLALYQFPIADGDIFRLQWTAFLRQTGMLVLNLMVGYCGLASIGQPLFAHIPAALLAAIVQSALIVALSVHLAAWTPNLAVNAGATLLSLAAFGMVFFSSSLGTALNDFISIGFWSNPSGWLNYALFHATRSGDYLALALLTPVALIIGTSVISWRRLRDGYQLHEPILIRADAELQPDMDSDGESGTRRGRTELQERIESRGFLQPLDWTRFGTIEKLATRLLKPRERDVAEFLTANAPRWTKKLHWGATLTLISSVVILFFGERGGFIVYFPAYLIISALLPNFSNEWRGLTTYPTGGLFAPIYALNPIAYHEIAAVILKINLIRCAAAFPLLATYGAIAAGVMRLAPITGILMAGKITVTAMALQPLFVVLRISAATNDTHRIRFRWVAIFVPFVIGILACGMGAFLSSSGTISAFSLIGMCALTCSILVLQRRFYRRGKFDLLTTKAEAFQS